MKSSNNTIIKGIEKKLQEHFGDEFYFSSERRNYRNTIQINQNPEFENIYYISELIDSKFNSKIEYPEIYVAGVIWITNQKENIKRILVTFDNYKQKRIDYSRYNPFTTSITLQDSKILRRIDKYPKFPKFINYDISSANIILPDNIFY